MKIFYYTIATLLLFLITHATAFSEENIVNIYVWSGVIPDAIIQRFEKETGIKVNFSTYDSNEIMYAKLKATTNPGYDIVEPSTYYIDRMHKQNMLEKLDKTYLKNFHSLNPALLNQSYDRQNNYSVPFIWGITGIFFNKKDFSAKNISNWANLWNEKYRDQLLMLDDSREVFSIALRTLHYSVNEEDPEHIKQAYLKLKKLIPNIKIFSSSPISMLIDEDASVGMVWNGDLLKASEENQDLAFIFPKDGFVIWVDNFAIPKNAPHQNNAYQFLNFIMRPDIARDIALDNHFATANIAGQQLLPPPIKNNAMIYPPLSVLDRGEFQTDVSNAALILYEKYWERLKMGG